MDIEGERGSVDIERERCMYHEGCIPTTAESFGP